MKNQQLNENISKEIIYLRDNLYYIWQGDK